jgi:hypothetical protein
MTKAGQTIFQQRKHMEWIALGAFGEVKPLVAAVTELTSASESLADLCLAGARESVRRVAAAQHRRRAHGRFRGRVPHDSVGG